MGRRVLLADDSATIHKVVGLAFKDEDVIVEAALDGTQAVERLRESRPDLLLVDSHLPIQDGYKLCGYVKSRTDLRHIPVVMLVGTFESFNEGEAARVQCDAHLVKPFDSRELVNLARTFWAAAPSPIPVKGSEMMDTNAGIQNEPVSKPSRRLPLVSRKTKESFLKNDRILDIVDVTSMIPVPTHQKRAPERAPQAQTAAKKGELPQTMAEPVVVAPEKPCPTLGADNIPDSVIDEIVERVIRKMSAEAVKDIAWEVIPELAEIIIRQHLKEHGLPRKE